MKVKLVGQVKSEELKKEELITQTFKDIESYTDKCSEDEISKAFDDVQTRYSKLGFKGVDDEYTGEDKIAIIWLMEKLFERVWDEARRDFGENTLKELRGEIVRTNNLKKLSGSNKEHLTHEARGYSRAIIILEKELSKGE